MLLYRNLEPPTEICAGDIDPISKRLDNNSLDTTVLAPLNSAIQNLPRKPWEDPKEYKTLGAQAYDGSGGEDRAYQNLKKFVEAHVVPVSAWEEGKKVETVAGQTLWWEKKEGTTWVSNAEPLKIIEACFN